MTIRYYWGTPPDDCRVLPDDPICVGLLSVEIENGSFLMDDASSETSLSRTAERPCSGPGYGYVAGPGSDWGGGRQIAAVQAGTDCEITAFFAGTGIYEGMSWSGSCSVDPNTCGGFGGAALRLAGVAAPEAGGGVLVSYSVRAQRYAVCEKCADDPAGTGRWIMRKKRRVLRCGKLRRSSGGCGCFMAVKTKLAGYSCPEGKW